MTKLAHLLNERADTNAAIDRHIGTILANLKTNEGEQVLEDPTNRLNELVGSMDAHLSQSLTLNELNRNTRVNFRGEDWNIADIIVLRQNWQRRKKLLKKFVATAEQKTSRWGRNELVEVINLDLDRVEELLQEASATLRDIDNAVQEVNWTADV